MRAFVLFVVVVVVLVVGACVAGPGSSASPGSVVPVGIDAVSRSNPNSGASGALDACSITDTTGHFGKNGPLGINLVGSMGLVPHAREIPDYAAFGDNVPEFQSDAPAWVIQIAGEVRLPLDPDVLRDPTCVVIAGNPIWFNTGAAIDNSGAVETPFPPGRSQKYHLPPLAP